jgi:hypothetical protein
LSGRIDGSSSSIHGGGGALTGFATAGDLGAVPRDFFDLWPGASAFRIAM